MANHLTPDELSEEVGMDRNDVIPICVEEHVPIYHGKIDKTLFRAQLATPPDMTATQTDYLDSPRPG